MDVFETQLEQIREGKVPIALADNGIPMLAHAGIYEMMQFLRALAAGYMRLYNQVQISERCRKKGQNTKKPPGEKQLPQTAHEKGHL